MLGEFCVPKFKLFQGIFLAEQFDLQRRKTYYPTMGASGVVYASRSHAVYAFSQVKM